MVSFSCFGVRVSVMFHFMFVHYTFSSVWVAEWQASENPIFGPVQTDLDFLGPFYFAKNVFLSVRK